MPRFLLMSVFFISAQVLSAQISSPDSAIAQIRQNPDNSRAILEKLATEVVPGLTAAQTLEMVNTIVPLLENATNKVRIQAYQLLGAMCWDKQLYSEALRFYNDSIALATLSSDFFEAANSHFQLADRFMRNEMYVDALERAYKARELFHNVGDVHMEARAYAQAANISFRARDYNLCSEEINNALKLYRLVKVEHFTRADSLELMNAYNTCGLAYTQLGEFRRAMASYNMAEQMAKAMNNVFWVALINGNKSDIYYKQGDFERAISSLQLDFNTSVDFGEWNSAINGGLHLSQLHMEQQKWQRAKFFLDTAQHLIRTHGVGRSAQARYWEAASRYYGHTGDYRKAYEAAARERTLKDSMQIEQRAMNLSRIKTNYDIQQQQAQIELLTAENMLNAERLANRNIVVIAFLLGIALLFALIFTIFRSYQQKKKDNHLLAEQNDEINTMNEELRSYAETLSAQNTTIQKMNEDLDFEVKKRTRELQEANAELDTFLYRASHDIRRPITTLLGLSNLAHLTKHENERIDLFDKVIVTAGHMDSMLRKLQLVYELNHTVRDRKPVSLRQAAADAHARYRKEIELAGLDYRFTMKDDVRYEADESLLSIVFQNLIENAVVFRKTMGPEQPHLWIEAEKLGNQVVIKFKDNGIGIDAKYVDNIFSLHFRATERSVGNGVGLYLVKKAINQLGGRIEVISEYGVGTTFIVYVAA